MDSNIEIRVEAHKKNVRRLPKAEAASIHIAGNKGKVRDGEFAASAFIIMVKCNGQWRPENEWLHAAGFKTPRRVYTDINKARAAKEDIKAKWGVEKTAKKSGKKGLTKADLLDKVAALSAMIEEMKKNA